MIEGTLQNEDSHVMRRFVLASGTHRSTGLFGKRVLFLSFVLLVVGMGSAVRSWAASDSMVDPAWKSYSQVSGVSGNLNSIGSDTLNNLMTLWAEGFRKEYPNVKIQIEGKGSSTAPPALIEGTAQVGPMSRQMKAKEMDKFEAKFGYKLTNFPVAVDALAVYVNKDNPVKCHEHGRSGCRLFNNPAARAYRGH